MQNTVVSKENMLGIPLPVIANESSERTFYTVELNSEYKVEQDALINIYFVLSPDIQHYERSIYTYLDFLGDVGGLDDALTIIAQIILFLVSLLTNSGPHEYILKKLFKRGKSVKTKTFNDHVTTVREHLTKIRSRKPF